MEGRTVLRGTLGVLFLCLLCQVVRLSAPLALQSCNPWGSFSVPWPPVVLVCIMIGALLFFALQWMRKTDWSKQWPWVVLSAGGLSNLYERLAVGCVTDYLALPFFPTFNLADVLLTLGIVGLGLHYLRAPQHEP